MDCAAQAFASGRERVRIDFDTTAGDLTYTTLKNSLPLVRALRTYVIWDGCWPRICHLGRGGKYVWGARPP